MGRVGGEAFEGWIDDPRKSQIRVFPRSMLVEWRGLPAEFKSKSRKHSKAEHCTKSRIGLSDFS